jgi:hypothetical protein
MRMDRFCDVALVAMHDSLPLQAWLRAPIQRIGDKLTDEWGARGRSCSSFPSLREHFVVWSWGVSVFHNFLQSKICDQNTSASCALFVRALVLHSFRTTPPTIGAADQSKVIIVYTRYGVTKRLRTFEIHPLGPVMARIRRKRLPPAIAKVPQYIPLNFHC